MCIGLVVLVACALVCGLEQTGRVTANALILFLHGLIHVLFV